MNTLITPNPRNLWLWSMSLLVLFCLVPALVAQQRWSQTEFVLGTWWDPPYDPKGLALDTDVAAFREARDAYFTLLSGTQGDNGIKHDFPGMRYALRVAARAGVRYLVSDYRFYEAYKKPWTATISKGVVEDYTHIPPEERSALYGYELTDEPHFTNDQFSHLAAWARYLQSADSSRLSFYNLVPCSAVDANWGGFTAGNQNGILDDSERVQYEEYLHLYSDSLRPAVVCFDHYPFFGDGTIRRDYFYNLDAIRRAAGKRPFWASPMAADHLIYIDPSEQHLRFMYFCPIAYGAQGLMVFTFVTPPYREFRSALLDREGKRTAKYDIVRRLNLYVKTVLGPVVMGNPCVAVYHLSDAPGKQLFIATGIPSDSPYLSWVSDDHMMVSVFEGQRNRYLLIVNKDLHTVANIDIALKGRIPGVFFAPRVIGFDETSSLEYRKVDTRVEPGALTVSLFRIPELAGGEGRLIRIR